ncbi:hybrid sensor histidine kinase/response regulator [Terrimonas alba]|uniref:hybrid sensor histidine kinase/response regulator n=1 Tax=Terrimonas alba TaxID=3349636 RepID=UPI0035F2D147
MNTELKLLLLEDNPADADLIQTLLKRAGLQFSAVVAGDEAEFLAAMKSQGYHAVLADNALPQYSSMEALKLIQKTNPHVAFILVTGTVSEEFAVNIIQQGADDYILKTNLTRLPAALKSAIEKKRSRYEKELAEKEREKEKELSISIVNSLPGVFFLCDRYGNFLRWNRNLEFITGYDNDEVSTLTLNFFIEDIDSYVHRCFATGYGETEALLIRRDGRRIHYYFTSRVVTFEEKSCLLGVGIDISASKQSALVLKQLNEELLTVSGHLERIREDEQARIAREVHDQLGQMLTGLKMDLSWLRNHNDSKNQASVRQRMDEMAALLDDAMRSVKKIASDLRPSVLDDFGLIEGLHWQSREFHKRYGVEVEVIHPEQEIDIDPSVAIGVFRIYQEALTNVARHAEATKVTTTLSYLKDILTLTVEDNGKGFDTSMVLKSLGLLGMRERAYIMNGQVTIKSEAGKGTTVSVGVPLSDNDKS